MAFDRNDPTQVAELKSEVETDPLGIGYNPANGDTGELLGLINAKNYTTTKPKISSAKVRATCTRQAYDSLSIDNQEWIRWMTGTNGFDEENMEVTQDLRDRLTGALGGSQTGDSIWSATTDDDMEPAMLALIEVPGSRAEVLWGYGTTITSADWFAARDS